MQIYQSLKDWDWLLVAPYRVLVALLGTSNLLLMLWMLQVVWLQCLSDYIAAHFVQLLFVIFVPMLFSHTMLVSVTWGVFIGGVVKDQAEADKDTNWKQRLVLAAGS